MFTGIGDLFYYYIFWITLFLIMLGVLSSIILLYGDKKEIVLRFIRSTMFFVLVSRFCASAVKCCTGDAVNTFFDSFWDMEGRTCIHYGIPLLVMSILCPFLLKKLFSIDCIENLINIFNSCMILEFFVMMILKLDISNIMYILFFGINACVSIFVIVVCKKELLCAKTGEYKKISTYIMPVVALVFVMVFLYYPSTLYIGNSSEFVCSYSELGGVLLFWGILSGVITILICLIFLPKKIIRFFSQLLCALLFMGYIQSSFLNGWLGKMDGNQQGWSVSEIVINSFIWITGIIGIVLLGYYKKKAVKVYEGICVYICLIQIVSLAYLLFTTDLSENNKVSVLSIQDSMEIATDENVFVFVLDRFDCELLEAIMKDDNMFLDPLSDFTLYNNGTSLFSRTAWAIPYMLTGTDWHGGLEDEYTPYAYDESDVLTKMKQDGWKIGIYTNVGYIDSAYRELIDNYRNDVELHCDFAKTVSTMFGCSMYQIVPFIMKGHYTYYSSDINEMVDTHEIWNTDNDLLFYNSLIQEGVHIQEDYEKAFKFYHMMGAHGPFHLTEDIEYDKSGHYATEVSQAKASLKIVYEYLEQLKTLGRYDDATVIITTDHGQRVLYETVIDGKLTYTSRPIFLVKEAGVQQERLTINETPVSQENLVPTIMKAMGMEWKKYGNTFDEMLYGVEYERTYIDYDDKKDTIVQYSITGNAKELDSWKVKNIEPVFKK